MKKILVVDDHAVVREGIKSILRSELKNVLVESAGDADTALKLLKSKPCDMIILDITMPGRSGLDLLKDIKQFFPSARVLVLSIHQESQYALRILKSGASGYITKDAPPQELLRAAQKILSGQTYLSDALAPVLLEELSGGRNELPHEALSNREFEVLRMLAKGIPLKEIAHLLKLSPKTITTYRTRILEKMGLESNAELTRYAVDNDLIE